MPSLKLRPKLLLLESDQTSPISCYKTPLETGGSLGTRCLSMSMSCPFSSSGSSAYAVAAQWGTWGLAFCLKSGNWSAE